MLSGFFYALREEGVPVSLHEWLTLMEALSSGLARDSLTDFYPDFRTFKPEKVKNRFDDFCKSLISAY